MSHSTPHFCVTPLLYFILVFSIFLPTIALAQATAGDDIEIPLIPSELEKKSYVIEKLPDADGTVLGDFVVGPGKVEFEVAPGEEKTVELTVSNRMGEQKRFQIEIEDAAGSSDPEKTIVLLGDDRGPYTLKDYIEVPYVEFELGHMERARIPVTIALPPDAEPGGRYGSVVVSTVTNPGADQGKEGARPSSPIISRIGTLFFITTPGEEDIVGQLQSFTTIPEQSLYFDGPITFGLLYENTGSVHLNPYGEISITNIRGDEVGRLEMDPWFTMPLSQRTREVSWDKDFMFGKYTATARINRGYDNVVDEKVLTCWVLPYK